MSEAAAHTTIAIVVAGGTGERFGRSGGKQLLEVAGRPVLARAVEAVATAASVDGVVVVCHPDRVDEYRAAVGATAAVSTLHFVAGGGTRQQSVERGLTAAESLLADIVVVHDGARPLVSPELVDAACSVLLADATLDGVVVGHPVTDTLKLAQDGVIDSTPDRARYWAVQTPQVFRAPVLRTALDAAERTGFCGTDDASVVEHAGGHVGLTLGPRDNLKITVAEDAAVAEAILAWKAEAR